MCCTDRWSYQRVHDWVVEILAGTETQQAQMNLTTCLRHIYFEVGGAKDFARQQCMRPSIPIKSRQQKFHPSVPTLAYLNHLLLGCMLSSPSNGIVLSRYAFRVTLYNIIHGTFAYLKTLSLVSKLRRLIVHPPRLLAGFSRGYTFANYDARLAAYVLGPPSHLLQRRRRVLYVR